MTTAGDRPTAISGPGLQLIKDFEGLELTSYRCSSGVLTLGWGHTGADVIPGQTITEAQAEALLKQDLRTFEDGVAQLMTVPLTQHECDAIVSFAFNCGLGALQSSTFRRRINAGDSKATVFTEEFPKWVKGPSGPLPGLVRRREAEIALALSE